MKPDQRSIPLKNYILLGFILLLTVFLTLLFSHLYKEKMEYNIQNNNTMEFLSEVRQEEWDNYILENHDAVVYISSSNDDQNRDFERKVKQYINRKNLSKDFVYLDAMKLEDSFYTNLKMNYLSDKIKKKNIDLETVPNVFIVKEQKITHILYEKTPSKLNIKNVEKFLKQNWIEE